MCTKGFPFTHITFQVMTAYAGVARLVFFLGVFQPF